MRSLFCIAAAVGLVMFAPGGAWADNQETAQQIANNLRTSGKMKGYSVGVKVEDGTAWLNGTVANQDQMVTALSIAQQTNGIDRVVNNLTIASAKSGGKSASGLRQPGSANQAGVDSRSGGQNSGRHSVVQAGMMDIPDQAKSDLMVAGPPPQMDDSPTAAPNQSGAPMPLPMGASRRVPYTSVAMQQGGPPAPMGAGPGGPGEVIGPPRPLPAYVPTGPGAAAPYHFDHPQMPGYAWPSYASYPNYAAVTYPKQYSPTAWPYIGPFYPYPQVPLGWRKVTLEWDDGWWFLDFKDSH
jgi:BON domain